MAFITLVPKLMRQIFKFDHYSLLTNDLVFAIDVSHAYSTSIRKNTVNRDHINKKIKKQGS